MKSKCGGIVRGISRVAGRWSSRKWRSWQAMCPLLLFQRLLWFTKREVVCGKHHVYIYGSSRMKRARLAGLLVSS